MPRLFLAVLVVTILCQFETLNVRCKVSAQTGCTPCYRPSSDPDKKIENKPANVTALTLSTDELTLPCEPGSPPREGVIVSPSMVIDVATTAEDVENDVLKYSYTVSGGRIIGVGANVKWDLSGVAPGTYTITAAVNDGCGICGKIETRTVTVIACEPSCSLIECPTIEIYRPPNDEISSGENTFTANVSGGSQESVSYQWIVNNGKILRGQGTPSIVVEFTEQSTRASALITIRIGGIDPLSSCMTEQTLRYENGRLKP